MTNNIPNETNEKVMLDLVMTTEQQQQLSENAKTMRETKKAMKSMLDDVKVKLLQTDVRRVENPDFCIDVAEQATVCQLDVNRLKKEAPDIYKQYLIHRQRRASARLRLK